MKPEEFLKQRQVLTNAPRRPDGPGGLIPTQHCEIENFPDAGEDATADALEGAAQEDEARMLFTGRVLNTFGKPIAGAVVHATDGNVIASCITNQGGQFSVLLPRTKPTEESEVVEEKAVAAGEQGRTAPPPPTPPSGPFIDVRVQADGVASLMTRFYFRDVPSNAFDAFYNGTRVIAGIGADFASYDIILNA